MDFEEHLELSYQRGLDEGYKDGQNVGYDGGWDDGLKEGDTRGYVRGYEQGWDKCLEFVAALKDHMEDNDIDYQLGVKEPMPVDCITCPHHHCYYDSDGYQDCSCDLNVFAKTQTQGIPKTCPLKKGAQ